MSDKLNILFTCAGRRTYLLKYFKEQLADKGLIIATDMSISAPALTVADVKIQVPSVYDPMYIDKILQICKEYNVRAVICLNDLELPIIAANKKKFEDLGVVALVADSSVIEMCFDKYQTAKFIESIGLRSPKTYVNYKQAISAIQQGDLQFPLVLKPRWGSGSIGIEFVNSLQDLKETYDILNKKIKKTILSKVSEGSEVILIQEMIEGQEYGVDIMNDLNGKNRGVSVKKKIAMRAGETDKAQTTDNSDIRRIGKILGEKLKHIGNLDADIFERDGQYFILELNPRFGGGFPFSYEAGVNFPKAIIAWLENKDVNDAILVPRYGLTFAKCDYLVSV